MGIHHNTWFVVDISTNHIGCFPSNTGQRRQIGELSRYLSVMLFQQCLTAGNDVFRLHMIKTGGVDILLQFFQLRMGKSFNGIVLLKQIRGYDVDSGIGTLGTQDYRNQ